MVLNKLKALFKARETIDDHAGARRAVAALLIHAARADGSVDAAETRVRDALLRDKFALADSEIADLVAEAEAADDHAADLYTFTHEIKTAFDRDQRMRILEMLWEVVLADGVIDEQEAHMVWRVSGLLGFTTRENGDARRAVQARLGQQED